jgi:hypothetical protein
VIQTDAVRLPTWCHTKHGQRAKGFASCAIFPEVVLGNKPLPQTVSVLSTTYQPWTLSLALKKARHLSLPRVKWAQYTLPCSISLKPIIINHHSQINAWVFSTAPFLKFSHETLWWQLLIHIRNIHDSNSGTVTGFPDPSFSWFTSCLHTWRNDTLKLATIASLRILSNSRTSSHHPNVQRHKAWAGSAETKHS